MAGACIGSLLLIPVISYFLNEPINLNPSMMDWFWISILALVFTVFPFSAMAHLLKKFSAFAVNLSLNLEPVYGIIIAFFVFGETEKMTAGFYVGTLIILLSVLAYPLLKQKVVS
jgi:drug/metabolite transporter (DMT)-like permease